MPGGRPREFDAEEALEAAVDVFRERGYAGASLSELTAAMGIRRPSLYAAFGDKERLFDAAVRRYAEEVEPLFAALEAEPDVRTAFRTLLLGLARSFTQPGRPPGCLVATCRAASAGPTAPGAASLGVTEAGIEAALGARLRRAQDEGQLAAGEDVPVLVRFFGAQVHALSSLARGGASRRELLPVARVASGVLRDAPPGGAS